MMKSLVNMKSVISEWFQSHKSTLTYCLATTFLWGLVAHAYGLLHNNLSHDVLNAFVATTTEEIWKIELGRFFVPVYRYLFRGAVSLPWLIGLVGLFWISLAVFFMIQLLDVKKKPVIALIAGIMVTNITYISQIATYVYEFDFNALALLLAVLAVYLWRKAGRWSGLIGGVLCLLISISIYQAYFAVAPTLMIWLILTDLFDEQPVKAVLRRGVTGLGMLVLALLLYFVVGKIVYAATGIEPQARVDVFQAGNIVSLLMSYAGLIWPCLRNLGDSIFHTAYSRGLLMILVQLAVGSLAVGAVLMMSRKRFPLWRVLWILVLVLILPFGMNCIYFIAGGVGVHDLMSYAAWFFYVFLLVFALRLGDVTQVPMGLRRIVKWAAYGLVAFVLVQNVTIANTAYVKKELDANATLSTMTRMVDQLEQRDDYVPGETPVAFVGADPVSAAVEGFEDVRSITGMWMDSSIPADTSVYYYNVYEAYFRYVLKYPMNICSDEVHGKLKADPVVAEMPSFPEKGYIKCVDGVLVVKMGE